MLRMTGYFFLGSKPGRLLDEGVDLPAVEALVGDLLGRREVELVEELLVGPRHGGHAAGGGVEDLEVADHQLGGDHHGHARGVRRGRVGGDLLGSLGDGLDSAAGGVEARHVDPAALARDGVDPTAVPAPDQRLRAAAPGRVLIAGEPILDFTLVLGGEVARLGARGGVHHEQVGLVVGVRGLRVEEAGEGDPPAVRRDGDVADRTVDVDDLPHLAAAGRDHVEVVVRGGVIGLLVDVGVEVDLRAVRRPDRAPLAERSLGELLRLRDLGAVRRHGDGPDVADAGGIVVAAAVEAVDRAGDDADVALPLPLLLLILFLLLVRGLLVFGRGLFRLLALGPRVPPLLQVLFLGAVAEGDGLAVRRPDRPARAVGQVGEGHGLAAPGGDQIELRRLALAVLLGGAGEDDPRAVGGPSGRHVPRAAGERSAAARRRPWERSKGPCRSRPSSR